MKIMALIVVGLLALALAGFVFLGLRSQAGAPPGLQGGRLAPCPTSPNCVSTEPGATEPNAAPLPPDVWSRIPAAVESLGGETRTVTDDYIAATFTSRVFRFVDDVEFRRAGDAVHVRSASRVGHSDMGVNAKRVEALRAELAAS